VEMLDGRPRAQLQLIGGVQAPGPCTDLLGRQSSTDSRPASQGLSTLGGGYCHDPFPELSLDHLSDLIATAPLWPHRVITRSRSRPTLPDQTRLASTTDSPPIVP